MIKMVKVRELKILYTFIIFKIILYYTLIIIICIKKKKK